MVYRYVFLLGRPGCGKSALYLGLEQRFLESGQPKTLERVDDFPKVWARLHRDDALEQEGRERVHSRRTSDGAYKLTNEDFFNDILQEVNSDVLDIDKPDHLVFIEFARPSYIEAIQNFDRSILERSAVVYMQVSFETCWSRNLARHEADRSQDGDDHFVYRETMEELYLHDDQEAFVQVLKDEGVPVWVVDNEADGERHLKKQVERLFLDLTRDWDGT